jgi:hypothetical protein
MPQTSYSTTLVPGQAGQLFDNRGPNDIVNAIAGAVIPPGVFCEFVLVSGAYLAFPLKDASPGLLSGTVTLTNASAAITFSVAQTLPAGSLLTFSAQTGVVYVLAESVTAGTAGVLATTYGGSSSSSGTTTNVSPGVYQPELIGVSMIDTFGVEEAYVPYAVPNAGAGSTFAGWPVGKSVPILRKGRIWTQWDGNTGNALPLAIGAMNVIHSSTGANPQGVVTTKAVSTTAGNEIDALPTACQIYDPRNYSGTYTDVFGNSTSVVVMQLNLPGK